MPAMNPTNEEIEDLALRLEIDYREHRYQNCQRAASMLRRCALPEVDAPQVSGVPMESLKAAHDRIAKSPVYGAPRRCLRYDKVGTPLQVCGGDGDWCLAEDVAALEAELVAMTAARDGEKAAHQRTIDYHAGKGLPTRECPVTLDRCRKSYMAGGCTNQCCLIEKRLFASSPQNTTKEKS